MSLVLKGRVFQVFDVFFLPACGCLGRNRGNVTSTSGSWQLVFFWLHQGLQPPQHHSSHRTLEALMLTLTQYLATTPMPTTWILQVRTPTLTDIFSTHFPLGASRASSTSAAIWRVWGQIVPKQIVLRLWKIVSAGLWVVCLCVWFMWTMNVLSISRTKLSYSIRLWKWLSLIWQKANLCRKSQAIWCQWLFISLFSYGQTNKET